MIKVNCEYKIKEDIAFIIEAPEWCVQSLLEMNNLSEEVFDCNLRLKKIMEEQGNY